MRIGVMLAVLLTVGVSTLFGVRTSALSATTSSPSLSVTGEVVGLPPGSPVTVRLEARYVDPTTGATVTRSQSRRVTYEPPQAAPRILRAYWIYHDTGSLLQEHVEHMRYVPNGFRAGLVMGLRNEQEGEPDRLRVVDPGSYVGWDVLISDNYASYTDVTGTRLLSPDAPGAVRQWINPKLRENPIQQKDEFRWIPTDPFYSQYRPTPSGLVGFETGNIEGALRPPN